MLVSCKQSIFLQRKYTAGLYFSKTGAIQLKEIHQTKTNNADITVSVQTAITTITEPLTDTIILNSGKKVPCIVKTIQRKVITYTDNEPGPAGEKKFVKNKKVARIHFNDGKKEYITQPNQSGNPLLQFDFIRHSKQPRTGMAIFGYIQLLLTGFGLIIASVFIGLLFITFALTSLIVISSINYESLVFKMLLGIGKFFGVLFFVTLSIIILALFIAIITFA